MASTLPIRVDTETIAPKLERHPYVDQGMELARLMGETQVNTPQEIGEVLSSAASAYVLASLATVKIKEL